MDGFADVHRVCAQLDGKSNLANHVARVRAHHAAAQDLAVAMRFGAVVKQLFDHAFVAASENGTARVGPKQQALLP